MPVQIWDGAGPVLVDTSAWLQARRESRARDLLLSAIERGEARWCWPVRYELIVDARGPEGIAAVERTLATLREAPVDRGVQRAVLATMRDLADAGSHGANRFPLNDLTVAAAAQEAGIDIVHFDQRLERLGDHLGVRSYWVSEPSSGS
jgi:predicted nucleic acid-binding protein